MNVLSTINEEQAAHYLAERHFEIGSEINRLSLNNNFAGIIQVLVNQTLSLLEKGEFKIVSQHLKYLDWIYQRGNKYIQEIVENLFVRSFKCIQRRSSTMQWKQQFGSFPLAFQSIYLTQKSNVKTQKL